MTNVSSRQDVSLSLEEENKKPPNKTGIFTYLKRIFSYDSSPKSESEPNHDSLGRLLMEGKALVDEVRDLQETRASLVSPLPRLTYKKALWIGGLLLGKGVEGETYRPSRQHGPDVDALWGVTFSGSFNPKVPVQEETARAFVGINMSVLEYNNPLAIVNENGESIIDSGKSNESNARYPRSVFIENKHIPNEILYIVQDESFDLKIRNEFDIIFRRADNSSDVKKATSLKDRNLNLLFKCMKYTSDYIKENESMAGNDQLIISVELYHKRLLQIQDRLTDSDKDSMRLIKKAHEKLPGIMVDNDNHELNDDYHDTFIDVRKRITLPRVIHKNKTSDTDHVKIKSLIYCRDEREHLDLVRIIKVISKTLKNPVTSLIKEGEVVLNYNAFGIGCVDDEQFYDLSKKIESAIDSLLFWIPHYGRTRLIIAIVSSLLDMIADAIEKKEFSLTSAIELESYMINLAKDLVSSVSAKQLASMAKDDGIDKITSMIKDLEINDNKLYINIKNEKIEISELFNHFSDVKKNKFIFYDEQSKWFVKESETFNEDVEYSLKRVQETFGDKKDTQFFLNNCPDVYGDGIFIINYRGVYALVENHLYPVIESQINKKTFRYVIQHYNQFLPIVTRENRWFFEDETTPSLSKDITTFLQSNGLIRERLVRQNIKHSDVGPMMSATKIQYDKNNFGYVKLNNEYYRLENDVSNFNYISGEYDVWPVKITSNNMIYRSAYGEGIYACYRENINHSHTAKMDSSFYLDGTVIGEIENKISTWAGEKSLSYNSYFVDENDTHNPISGALKINNEYFLPYEDKLIKIVSNGDDTYTLGDDEHANNIITVYKNPKSNTYFLLPKKTERKVGNNNFKRRRARCFVKRQVFSLCETDFYETPEISDALDHNKDSGIKIENPDEKLSPYLGANGFYKDKENNDVIYYRSSGDIFFHAKETQIIRDEIIPVYFTLYGKQPDGSIDESVIISPVSIIKDFDTKKIIVSTPSEAQETILNIETKMSEKLLDWQGISAERRNFHVENIEEVTARLTLENDIEEIYELFERSGKKWIVATKAMNAILPVIKSMYFGDIGDVEFKTLTQLKTEQTSPILYEIYDEAHSDAVLQLKNAISFIKESRSACENYVSNRLGISDKRAAQYFIDALFIKLNRMDLVLDDKNKENIVLAIKNKPRPGNEGIIWDVPSGEVLGVADSGDPLDRLFINTINIPEGFTPSSDDNKYITERMNYVNSVSNTILHEAVHAIGYPEDYVYVQTNNAGGFPTVEESISQIESNLRNEKMNDRRFQYLCKLYFMSNPAYKDFMLDSLVDPKNLACIFQSDNYLKGLFLINTPDTVSQIISDLPKNSNPSRNQPAL